LQTDLLQVITEFDRLLRLVIEDPAHSFLLLQHSDVVSNQFFLSSDLLVPVPSLPGFGIHFWMFGSAEFGCGGGTYFENRSLPPVLTGCHRESLSLIAVESTHCRFNSVLDQIPVRIDFDACWMGPGWS
jgi:hypothetical protein